MYKCKSNKHLPPKKKNVVNIKVTCTDDKYDNAKRITKFQLFPIKDRQDKVFIRHMYAAVRYVFT